MQRACRFPCGADEAVAEGVAEATARETAAAAQPRDDIEAAFCKGLTATPQYFAVAEWNETSQEEVVYTELYGSRIYLWIWGGGHLLQYGTSGVVRGDAPAAVNPGGPLL